MLTSITCPAASSRGRAVPITGDNGAAQATVHSPSTKFGHFLRASRAGVSMLRGTVITCSRRDHDAELARQTEPDPGDVAEGCRTQSQSFNAATTWACAVQGVLVMPFSRNRCSGRDMVPAPPWWWHTRSRRRPPLLASYRGSRPGRRWAAGSWCPTSGGSPSLLIESCGGAASLGPSRWAPPGLLLSRGEALRIRCRHGPVSRDSGTGALFLAARASCLHHERDREHYSRKRAPGMKHAAAVICGARRQIRMLWTLLREERRYRPEPPLRDTRDRCPATVATEATQAPDPRLH